MNTRLYEISFEVCNKVGGIHTVLMTKATYLERYYEEYILIGPYFEQAAIAEFESYPLPTQFASAVQKMEEKGFKIHFGKWQIPGKPLVFLIEFKPAFALVDEYKGIFYNDFQVESLFAGYDYNEPMAFSIAAGMLIELLEKEKKTKSVCHTHEWMTGFTNLYLKKQVPHVATVFTTHATMLGRALCGSGQPLYDMLETMDPYQEAKKSNVVEKFTAERACAKYSDVFTTVSDVTAYECEKILGRKPDVILYNGIDVKNFPDIENAIWQFFKSRKRLNEFLQYYFFPYHQFDLSKTSIFFSSGRYEVRNKGLDITLAALGKLNQELKGSDKTVVCLFVIPFAQDGIRKELLESKIRLRHSQRIAHLAAETYQDQLVHMILNNFDNLTIPMDDDLVHQIRVLQKRFHFQQQHAPFATHYINEQNTITDLAQQYGLHNGPENNVKIIHYPMYLEGNDGLLDQTYYKLIGGCDLGIFPSYYEPWGYTPAEGLALGIPVVTSDLAGFGRFMQKEVNQGLFILPRQHKSYQEGAEILKDYFSQFINSTTQQIAKKKVFGQLLRDSIDWSILIKNYITAHKKAGEKHE